MDKGYVLHLSCHCKVLRGTLRPLHYVQDLPIEKELVSAANTKQCKPVTHLVPF